MKAAAVRIRPISPFFGILGVEARTQFQSGLSALYLGMPLVWILIVRLIPGHARPLVAMIGTYSDPVMMGQVFVGAFLARERDQGLLEAWAVSPLGAGSWLAARILLIGVQAALGGLVLAVGAGVPFRPGILVLGLFLAASSAAMIGVIVARPFKDILSYFVLGGIMSTLCASPIVGILLRPSWIWFIPGPAASTWTLLYAAFGIPGGERFPVILPMTALGLWTAVLFSAARRVFHRGFFRRPGKGASL